MRSAVDQILKFNRGFHNPSLKTKITRMGSTPFTFFRGTYHLFCRDIQEGPFRKWPCLSTAGAIVADLHTENFGTFRSVNGEIVYDVNDFDETTKGPYEYDLRRLGTSLVLASLTNGHSLGDGLNAAEHCIRGYLDALRRLGKLATRVDFEKLKERKDVRSVLASAGDRSRAEMMSKVAVENEQGFRFHESEAYHPVSEEDRAAAVAALPMFLKNCLAAKGDRPERFTLQDVAFRIAGCGSLGRLRYALLLGKGGKGPDTFDTLRLMEWKDSLDSALDSPKPHQSKNRAKDVVKGAIAFQVMPKRYLGYTVWDGRPMQGREIGANDIRFDPHEFQDLERFRHASRIFGEVTARCHLVSTIGKSGPRAILKALPGAAEDRWVNRMVAFAVAYTDGTLDDFAEFEARKEEIAKAWA